MAEQILRTCYSFVIYNTRPPPFSSALHDANGNSAAQGNQDIAVHVGTLHFTCKDVMRAFEGDMHPGTSMRSTIPSGGTHFPDVRLIRRFSRTVKSSLQSIERPVVDVGGSVPGSFDVHGTRHVPRGLRMHARAPVRQGALCRDVAHLIAANTRDPASIIGDIHAQAQRPRYVSGKYFGSSAKYGRETVETGLSECRIMWSAPCANASRRCRTAFGRRQDFIDRDPAGSEGLIPINGQAHPSRAKRPSMISSGSHPTIGSIYNPPSGTTSAGARMNRSRCDRLQPSHHSRLRSRRPAPVGVALMSKNMKIAFIGPRSGRSARSLAPSPWNDLT